MANVYSFNIPGDMAAVELMQRLVDGERQALVGLTPLDSTGPNTILLVTDLADYAARLAEQERVFLVLDNKLHDPVGFVAALRVIEQGPSIEEGGTFYAYAQDEGDDSSSSTTVASVINLPKLAWMDGMDGLVEVMISTENGGAATDESALEQWVNTFGLCVAEASAEGASRLHLKGLVRNNDGTTYAVNEVIDLNTIWEN